MELLVSLSETSIPANSGRRMTFFKTCGEGVGASRSPFGFNFGFPRVSQSSCVLLMKRGLCSSKLLKWKGHTSQAGDVS